jgi:hypothetical protein
MTKRFFASWGGAFGDAARTARALPWLVVVMAAIELAQHGIEVRTGFFSTDPATRHAAGLTVVRLAFGWPKMLIVWGLAFFATRYLVLRDRRVALRPSGLAVRRYGWVLLFQFVPTAIVIYAEPILKLFGATSDAQVMGLRVIGGLTQQLLEPAFLLWFVNAAVGTRGYGPIASARATGWWYFWVLLLIFVTRIPFSTAHQLLNRFAAGQPFAVLWPMLVLDAVVVPAMVLTVAAVQLRAARAIAERHGRTLLEG